MRRKIVLFSIGTALLFIVMFNGLTSNGAAASSQWFPTSSTQCNYSVSWILTYRNGTSYSANTFKAYNDTGDGSIWLVPTPLNALSNGISGDWVKIANDVALTISNVYDEKSSTTLNRSLIATFNGTTYRNKQISISPFINASFPYQLKYNTTVDVVQKSGFYTWATNFLDYFDCSLNPGQSFKAPMKSISNTMQMQTTIFAKTPNYIIATWIYSPSGVYRNGTYLADLTGQIVSYTETYTDTINLGNILAYSTTYTRITTSSDIPGFELSFVVIATILGGCIILLGKKKKFTN